MIFIPAIDLIDGKCVRLYMGDYSKRKEYSSYPEDVAKSFEDEGAEFLHIVDLDAAKNPEKNNLKTIEKIIKAISIPVEVGGGVRTVERVRELQSIGVRRIIIGTIIVKNPEIAEQMISNFNDLIAVSIDAKDGIAYISGWTESGGIDAVQLGIKARDMGVKLLIYTDISRDGTLVGPNIEGIRRMAGETGLPVIAAGGISSIEDLKRVKSIEKDGIIGVISGKAIYEGKFSVREAIGVLR